MADFNIRGIDERTMQTIGMAAAKHLGHGGKRAWAIQTLAAAARLELNGEVAYPKLKLCARCVLANKALGKAPSKMEKAQAVAQMHPAAIMHSPFAHLIQESFRPVEVAERLFVGSDGCVWPGSAGYSKLSAAKEPWHREMVSYQTKSAPEGPERLFARRGNHLALNLIDVRALGPGDQFYVPTEVITAALGFIDERLAAGDSVLIHAGDGKSSAPGIAFAYMRKHGMLPARYEDARHAFKEKYADFEPNAGMSSFLSQQDT
jgi:hypothetical protein